MADVMYAMKPVFNLDAKVELPGCVYPLPVLQVSKSLNTAPPGVYEALEARQEAILARLAKLREDVNAYRKSIGLAETSDCQSSSAAGVSADIVIRCSPSFPPHSLPGLVHLLSNKLKVHTSCHTHSSVSSLPSHLSSFLPPSPTQRGEAQVKFSVIWKEVGKECEVMVSPLAQSVIRGEVNLVRYLARCYPAVLPYESQSNCSAVDTLLDCVTSLLWAAPKDRQPILRPLAINLSKTPFLVGETVGLADLALYSAIKQLGLDRDLQPEFRRWFTLVSTKMGGRSHRRSRYSSSRKSFRNSRRYSEKEKTPNRDLAGNNRNNNKNKEKSPQLNKEKTPPAAGGNNKNNRNRNNSTSENNRNRNNNNNNNRGGKGGADRERSPRKSVTMKEESPSPAKSLVNSTCQTPKQSGVKPRVDSSKNGAKIDNGSTSTETTDKQDINGKNNLKHKKGNAKKTKTVKIDRETNNEPGSTFTKQWPEIRHVFQASCVAHLLESPVAVSEKLDGSNLAITSKGVVASRRTILLNQPSAEELAKFKFSGVTLDRLAPLQEKLSRVENHFRSLLPTWDVEFLLYGELIQQGTATSKEDKYRYRPRGYTCGDLFAFGGGISFVEKVAKSEVVRMKSLLVSQGYNVLVEGSEEGSGHFHLILLMNKTLKSLLNKFCIMKIVPQDVSCMEEIALNYREKLVQNNVEGVVLVLPGEIYKWKGVEESYPDLFLQQITDLEQIVSFTQPNNIQVIESFQYVAQSAREQRQKHRSLKQVEHELQTAFLSAQSKFPTIEEQLKDVAEEDRKLLVEQHVARLKQEMARDSHNSTAFLDSLHTFLHTKYPQIH